MGHEDTKQGFIALCTIQSIFSLIVASTATFGSPASFKPNSSLKHLKELQNSLRFVAFVGWSDLLVTIIALWTLSSVNSRWARKFWQFNEGFLSLSAFFWLSGAIAIAVAFAHAHCKTLAHCSQVQTVVAFSWLSYGTSSGRMPVGLFMCDERRNTQRVLNIPPLPEPQTQNTPDNVRNTEKAHLEAGTYRTGLVSQDQRCLQCDNRACQPDSIFCSAACSQASRVGAPKLLRIPSLHVMHQFIIDRFTAEWRSSRPRPIARFVYAIISTESNDRIYCTYRDSVERRQHYVQLGMKSGNEQFRWKATSRLCTVGDPSQQQPCSHSGCSLCSIIRQSFDMERYGPSWGRFGKGVYSSATSSKAHDESRNLTFSPYMALLLNNVVIGNGMALYENNPRLTQPPPYYDSVLGEPGRDLDHDETVIYRNDAIRPAYLLIYDDPNEVAPD